MPYDAYGNEIPSKANPFVDSLRFGSIGGIGQLVYHLFLFEEYDWDYDKEGTLVAYPICGPGKEPILYTKDSPTGYEILSSLYNLAKKINDPSNDEPYTEQILNWCKKYSHPYGIEFIHAGLADEDFSAEQLGFLVERDGRFSIAQFMQDLEKLYQATQFSFALDRLCADDESVALALHIDGKHFEGLPFFNQYRFDPDDAPFISYGDAEGDLLKEMQMEREAQMEYDADNEAWGIEAGEGFARDPLEDYEALRQQLLDLLPSFNLRLKTDPKTCKAVFAADVESVFDIAWFALARKISEDAVPEGALAQYDEDEGIIMTCQFCGEAYVREKGSRRITCGSEECQRARKRMNTRNRRANMKRSTQ